MVVKLENATCAIVHNQFTKSLHFLVSMQKTKLFQIHFGFPQKKSILSEKGTLFLQEKSCVRPAWA